MDRLDGNSRSANNPLSTSNNNILQNNDHNDDFGFGGSATNSNTRGLPNNDNRHLPTNTLPNSSATRSNNHEPLETDTTYMNIHALSISPQTLTRTNLSSSYGQGLQNALEIQLEQETVDENVIDLAVVGHVTPYYVMELQRRTVEFAVEFRL